MGYRKSYGITEDLRYPISKVSEHGAVAYICTAVKPAYFRFKVRNALHLMGIPHLVKTSVKDEKVYLWLTAMFGPRITDEIITYIDERDLYIQDTEVKASPTEDMSTVREALKKATSIGVFHPADQNHKFAIETALRLHKLGLIDEARLREIMGEGDPTSGE